MSKRKELTLDDFIQGFKKRDLSILARAITYLESSRSDHKKMANALLTRLLKEGRTSIRLGISGTPGVGKSTFIEAFGKKITARKKSVAVLAIDPSSEKTGGSILGDKTRMNELAIDAMAFIRPSPSGKTLGGVASRTREALLLCEAFGFDYILVETVGVGQSEVAVSKFVDFFMLLMQPGGGDDLQGIKRGILELANIVVVNKADGELLNKAKVARQDLKNALSILRHDDEDFASEVFLTSSLEKTGLDDILNYLESTHQKLSQTGKLEEKRKKQTKSWFDQIVFGVLQEDFLQNEIVQQELQQGLKEVLDSKSAIYDKALAVVQKYKESFHDEN